MYGISLPHRILVSRIKALKSYRDLKIFFFTSKTNTMLLIADSGATKTAFILLDKARNIVGEYNTMGFSPLFHSATTISTALCAHEKLSYYANAIQTVHYFGAGCSSTDRINKISTAFSAVFTSATINVRHDMYAAALATCHDEAGIACILGTGSNSCYFDGSEVSELTPALDYVLGDEGSGTQLGKALLRSYLYRQLPNDLKTAFEARYTVNKEIVLEHVYQSSHPKKYLASFAQFIDDHQSHPYLAALAKRCFDEFLVNHILIYPQHQQVPIHFVGSVAYHFRNILGRCLSEAGLKRGKIVKSPIYELVAYFKTL